MNRRGLIGVIIVSISIFSASIALSKETAKASSEVGLNGIRPFAHKPSPPDGEVWQAGWDYNIHLWISSKFPPMIDDGKVEIMEIALYTDWATTDDFRGKLNAWLKENAEHVNYIRVPRTYSAHSRLQARMAFTLEALDRGELHEQMRAWVKSPNREPTYHVWNPDEAAVHKLNLEFAKQHGISPETWASVFYSDSVSKKVQTAETHLASYSLNGNPTFVVNRKYSTSVHRVAFPRSAPYDPSEYDKLLELLNYLAMMEI